MSNNQNNKDYNLDDEFVVKLGKALVILMIGFLIVCFRGLKRVNFLNKWVFLGLLVWVAISELIVLFDYAHLRFFDWLLMWAFDFKAFYVFKKFGPYTNLTFVILAGFSLITFILGVFGGIRLRKYQQAIETVGAKTPKNEVPKVVSVSKISPYRKVIRVDSPGMSPDEWKKYKDNLSFAFRASIDDISVSSNRSLIEIFISENDLPSLLKYDPEIHNLDEPYTFIVGQSKTEFLSCSIRSCPHLLTAGCSGQGKSTALKLMIYSLLESTPHEEIEFKLLDLKHGVEFSDFKGIPNATTIKSEEKALEELQKVKAEMKRRYSYLEKNNYKKIEPKRDKIPLLIVAVDEASVIFGKKSRSSSAYETNLKSRELCEEIAKLGRAAGVHLMLGTQRATSTSIDPVTMDNINARFSFKTTSISGSTAILGNKAAFDLPDTKGRSIWQKGVEQIEIQVPYIEEEVFEDMCKELREERVKLHGKSKQTMDSETTNADISIMNDEE